MRTIKNEKEYNAILHRIDELLQVVTDENWNDIPEAVELDFLSSLVKQYEKVYYPISIPDLTEVLKLRMHEMGLNQKELAELLGVSASRITEYLSGKEPTLKIARTICEKLNISAYVVLGVKKENRYFEAG